MSKLLVPNSTQVPNVLLDELMPILGGAEFKCLMYIARRTYGFRKIYDSISLTQFEDGITTKDGKKLDSGTGLSRETIVNALNKLVEIGIVTKNESKETHGYGINSKFDLKEVVGKPDHPSQSENPTDSGQKIRPVVVGKSDTQNKVQNKGNKDICETSSRRGKKKEDEEEPMDFKQFVEYCKKSPSRLYHIIADYAEDKKVSYSTKGQWRSFIQRNLRAAKVLKPHTEAQISNAFKKLEVDIKSGFLKKWTLETVIKYLD